MTKIFTSKDLERLEQELREFRLQLEEQEKRGSQPVERESKKEGKWKPAQDDEIWFRNMEGKASYLFYHEGIDIKSTPVFPTKERCERYWHFMDTVKEKSYEFSKEEWEDTSVEKYFINYDSVDEEFDVDFYSYLKFIGTVYFKREEDAQYIIDNFKDELMEYWI